MIQFFRSFFQSKIGLAITFAFLALIAVAFASMDVAGNSTFGGISGGDRVAVVGDTRISTSDLSRRTTNAVNQIRRDDPTISIRSFVEGGGVEEVLNRLIDRYAISTYARKYGLRAGDNLVNSDIMQISAFAGPDGNFSDATYRQALAQQGITDAMIRADLADELLQRQLVDPAVISTAMPSKIARRYTALLKERRKGAIAYIPSALFAPKQEPSEKQLQDFYAETRGKYIRPERRTLRYASFGVANLGAGVEPTAAEIAARYERDKTQYAAKETRLLTQLIVPTQDAAVSLRSRVAGGASLEAAARAAGFSTTSVGPVTREEYQTSSNAQVTNAVFAAAQGSIAEPVRGALGWHVVRVERIDRKPAQTLAQVTPSIRETLGGEKRLAALADLSARVEEQIDEGASLTEIAKDLGVEVLTSQPLTADGRVYGDPTKGTPEALRGAVETAFQMEEGEPQLAEIVRGQSYLIFEASQVTPSASAPLAEIKPQVTVAWRLAQGSKLAREAADRILKGAAKPADLAAVVGREKVALPAIDQVDLNRQELVTQNQQQVPPPLALMFSMAAGTTKKLQAPQNLGWFVIALENITVDPVAAEDPLVAAAQRDLGGALQDEYRRQLVGSIRKELGVERNDNAIAAVRKQLTGEN
ncbi:MAG: peptidylprolyl isomerase [Alphaproteobacteria bacterium]|nr:MAG: peptidylprolyl isomerase [Alphaproteobacteria bacterium]